jgi:iron complex outermembrane receptor protein
MTRTLPALTPLALAAALACGAPAFAQQPGAGGSSGAQPAAAPDDGKVEQVTITATKRPQPLQTTPIAISVISGQALEESNLNNLSTITAQTPTVNFRTNASNKDSALFIRGVGTISTSPGVEPTVSTVLDGVVTMRPGQATLDLVEIDRIEILRGPQGTLFGKNASAGVINIITRAPGREREGYVDLSYYQGGERRIRAGVSGPLGETVRAGISAMAGKYDGNVTNVFDGSTVNGYDRKGVRGRVDLRPTSALTVALIADYTKATDTTPTGVAYSLNVTTYPTGAVTANPLFGAALAPAVASPTNRQINSEMKTRVMDENSGFSAQVDYRLANHQITSITALRKWDNEQFQDQDRLSQLSRNFNQIADRGLLDFRQVSQELRIASTTPQFFDYVAGLFFIDGKNDETYRRDVTRCPTSTEPAQPNGIVPCSAATTVTDNGVAIYGVRSKSASVFGEGTFNFSPALRAIAGLRYTDDELDYYHGRTASATGVPGVGATRARVEGGTTKNKVSGRLGGQFNVNQDVMAYATYSRGYKGPAFNVFFNMSPTQDNVIGPEESKAYELGLKTTLAGGRVRLNLAAFQTDYSGYQANVPDLVNGVIVTRLINAGDVSTKGFEVDLTARVTSAFTLNAALAHTKARVENFACPPNAAASCNINGRPLPFSPDWKASLRARYTQGIGGGLTIDYGVDGNWQSKVNYDLAQQPDSVQKAYGILNASIGLASTAGWRVALVGKNLTDQSYATFIQSSGNHINRYVPRDDQRYWGVTARYDF